MTPPRAVGLDFGTSNSVLALADAGAREAAPVRFTSGTNFPSVLCFYVDSDASGREVIIGKAGQAAIDAYLKLGADCRLIQSIKSHLANRSFTETRIHGRRYAIEDLIAVLLRTLRDEAETEHGSLGMALTAGRPVHFVGAHPDEELALSRLTRAYGQAGFTQVDFAPEPLGAAYTHVRQLTRSEVCLIADLGGGTSDFSLVRFHPDPHKPHTDRLAHAGLGLAGDHFDFRIIEHVVTPHLGRGTTFRSGTKDLPIPAHIYGSFQRWNELSMLKAGRTLNDLRDIAKTAEAPDAIEALIDLIEEEQGYALYRAVGRTKAALSDAQEALFTFQTGPLRIEETVTRSDFEAWIARDVDAIMGTLTEMLATSNMRPESVGHVFLTGGTSFVPAIRKAFTDLFGAEKIGAGGEFVSVATGLALIAQEEARAPSEPKPQQGSTNTL